MTFWSCCISGIKEFYGIKRLLYDVYSCPNLFAPLPLISSLFIGPILVSEHFSNVGQFDILARKIQNLQSFIK